MFYEPTEREINLLPIVVHGVEETVERVPLERGSGFGTCGQITLSLSGGGLFIDSFKNEHIINSGDIFFVTPEAPHSYRPINSPWRVKYILFSGGALSDIFSGFNIPSSGFIRSDSDCAGELVKLFSEIAEVYKSGKVSRHISASGLLYRLITLIAKNGGSSERNLEVKFRKLAPAAQYIKEHFDDCLITSEMIAKHSGLSYPHLCRLFTRVYGMTLHDYLIGLRIEKAKLLLSGQKDMPIERIAHDSGFNSVRYFSTVFKAKTGFTPAHFRRQTTYDF